MQEKIQLTVDTTGIKANSLSSLVAELKSVDALIQEIYGRMGKGPTIGSAWLQPVEQIKQKLDRTFKVKGPYAAGEALKAIGLDEASVNQALARLNQLGRTVRGFQPKTGTFNSLNSAALGISQAFKSEVAALNQAIAGAQTAIGKALRGQGPQGVSFSGKDFAVKVDGQIGLVIPAAQVQASVSGPIALKVEGGGSRGEGGGGGRDAATGQFLPGGGRKKTGGTAQGLEVGVQRNEISRIRMAKIEAGEVTDLREAITRANEAGEIITDVHDSVEGLIKTVTRSTTGQSPLARYRQARQVMAEEFRAQQAALDPAEPYGLPSLLSKQASALRGMAASDDGKFLHPALAGLPAPVASQVATVLAASAATLDARALASAQTVQSAGRAAVARVATLANGGMSTSNWLNYLQGSRGLGIPVTVATGMLAGPAAQLQAYYTAQANRAAKAAAREAERMRQPPKNLGSIQWAQTAAAGGMATANWLNFLQGAGGQGVPVTVGTGMASGPAAQLRAFYTAQAAKAAQQQARAVAQQAKLAGAKQYQSVGYQLGGPQALAALLGTPKLPNAGPGIVPPTPKAPPGRIQTAVQTAFAPESLAVHTIKAAGWAMAITAIYKPLELAEYSLKRFLDLGEQMAHLGVIFRGVGGSTKELTEDVMRLAAVNGRSSDEAMESATEWARLGMSRIQINKAVQVSLEAANVAQISVGDATKQMSALMHIYGMSVDQLDDALGTLVNTSQKFNVTTEDLLGGLDRSAAAAKLAGVSFAELQGWIGATAGGTGQSGVQIGNTIKNLLTQFTRPEIQAYLQSQGVATMAGGQFGSGSEVMRRMFIQYQKMDDTQRRNLGTVIAGRLQTARFAGLMNEYPEAQRLAIAGLLRQNAAPETNQAILRNPAAQWRGVLSEWDRVVVSSGGTGRMAQGLRTFKNVLGGLADTVAGGDSAFNKTQTKADAEAKRIMRAPTWSAERWHGLYWAVENSITHFLPGGAALRHHYPQKAGITDLFNARSEGPDLVAPDAFAQGRKTFNDQSQNQEALELIQRQMETAAELQKSGSRTEGARQTYRDAREHFTKLGLGANATFEQGAVAAQAQQVTDLVEKMRTLVQMKQAADRDLASAPKAKRQAQEETYKQQLDEIEKLGETEKNTADEVLSTVAEQISHKQEYIDLLKEEAGAMELIGRLSSQIQTGTATGAAAQQAQALVENIASLQASMKSVADTSPVPAAANPAYQELARQMSEAKAQLATIESPRHQAATQAYDDRAITIRRTTTEAASYAVGYTEAEKLLRQRDTLTGELGPLRAKRDAGTATEDELVRGAQLQVELAKNHEQIQMRIVELKGQEKQILIDANREYQKSMLFAGPGELLKRLYAGSRGPMSAGQFMSLDPESRRMYYEQHGGDAGAKNREEQWLLRGSALTLPGEHGQAAQDRRETNRWGAKLPNPMAGLPGLKPPDNDPVLTQAMKSAQALSDFTGKLLTASHALETLNQALAKMGVSVPAPAATPATPPPAADLSSGYAPAATQGTPAALPPVARGGGFTFQTSAWNGSRSATPFSFAP